MRSILLFFTLSTAAIWAVDPAFTTGQAARLMIGQPNFTAQEEGASDTRVGAVGGIAWANGQLYVADANRVGATPQNQRVLIYRNVPAGLPKLTDEFAVNDLRCQICVGKADVVLGQPDFTTVPDPLSTTPIVTSRDNLRIPVGIATDGTVLAVSDTDNNRILIWRTIPQTNATPPDIVLGQANFTATLPNDGNGQTPNNRGLRGPQGIWIQNGKLFVADSGNNRILIWNSIPSASYTAADVVVGAPNFNIAVQPDVTKTTPNPQANTMLTPVAVSSDGQRLYVADLGYNRVLIWNSIPTQNNAPADVVVGQPDMTTAFSNYSVDPATGRPDQAYVKGMCESTGMDEDGNPTYPQICSRTLNFPRFVLSDGHYLFIADAGNDRILVYNTIPTRNGAAADAALGQINFENNLISDNADPGGVASSGAIRSPLALAFDGLNLYATDPFNRRILIFTLSERRVPNTGVRNAASREVFATNTFSLGNTTGAALKVGEEVTLLINSREYKHKIAEDETLLDIQASLTDQINLAPDPDVTALLNENFGFVTLTARAGGVAGNDITFELKFAANSILTASPLSGNLRGGNDAAKIAPGTIVTILGDDLADSTVVADPGSQVLPRELGGVHVYFDGIRAPLLSVSPGEVRAQIPVEVSDADSTNAVVRTVGRNGVRVTAAISVPIVGYNPGIFALEGVTDPRPGIVTHSSSKATALLNVDGIVNGGDRATVSFDGRPYTYIVQEGDTLTTVRDALIQLINQDPAVEASVAGTFNRIRVQARIEGPAGNNIAVSSSVSSDASLVLGFTNTKLCCANVAGALVTERNPALPGEQIAITATGLGLVKQELARAAQLTGIAYNGPPGSDPREFVSSLAGGKTANVVSASLKQGAVGVYEVILELNTDIPTNPLTQATIAQGVYVSNIVTFPVFNPIPVVTPPVAPTGGLLTGTLATPSGTQDLSAIGVTDWVHWGMTTASTVNRKTGTPVIGGYTPIGGGTTTQFSENPVGFSWNNGTPTASVTNTATGVHRSGLGSGFSITVPADTTERTLILYVGLFNTQGQLTARLSDSSAAQYTDTTLTSTGVAVGQYTLKYKAASSGQTLTVTFTQATNTPGNVTLQAAAMP